MSRLQDISLSIQEGNVKKAISLVATALKEKRPPADILRDGLAAGMIEMEKKFNKNEILDSEILIAEFAMKAALHVLESVLQKDTSSFLGTVIIGTLEGDIRETGKNIVSCLMQSQRLKVIDLGTSVSNIRFIEAAIEEKAELIACNAALTIFLPQMKAIVQAEAQTDIREKTKVLFSGAPVTEWFCKTIEADLYAPDPVQAAEIAAEHCRKLGAK